MGERGPTMVVSDQDIAQALESLLRETNPSITLTSLNGVVQQLQSKLGFDLTHKVDFIRNQIHLLLLRSTPQPPHFHHHQQKDHFALHQNPNFQPVPPQFPLNFALHQHPNDLGFRPQQPPPPPPPPPATKTESFVIDAATSASASTATTTATVEAPKESSQTGKKRRGGPGGLNKLCGVSPELQAIVGQPALPRTEIVKQLWAYIRKNNLQDPSNKRKIICNDELRLVFETDCTDMFKMNKLLAKHILPLEPTKPVGQNSKKAKVEEESGTKSAESDPIVIISEALTEFFGSGGREMLHSEVLRRVWEYIKVNQLEDPMNPMVIRCDTKLQELFGCASISAVGISEMLARHHLFKR
ncbi:Upstream activation factor subunit spp27 like [Actinidia chinensis var. chinensis]|uniref:Upstream activation factor subunit spp27 like n=1 Tax=Actinidia chinensis var. chinensis TaxID=1590841 RepID=A0A2R6P581_ACTCC|nr:Upstream activation factor subunit spp27 like [Actinidia chinensis var. chinensis]